MTLGSRRTTTAATTASTNGRIGPLRRGLPALLLALVWSLAAADAVGARTDGDGNDAGDAGATAGPTIEVVDQTTFVPAAGTFSTSSRREMLTCRRPRIRAPTPTSAASPPGRPGFG